MPESQPTQPTAPRNTSGEAFIHSKQPRLHVGSVVEHEQARRARAGEQTHAKPADKLADWMEVLDKTHGHSDKPEVLERIKRSYHRRYVIKPANVPESAFELEQRIARQQGHGDIPLTPEYRQAKTAEIISNQEASLDNWVDYLTSDDALYPTWAKYWAFDAITKMGKFEKKVETQPDGTEHEVARFAKRDATTTAPFPPLNPRALALTIGVMQDRLKQKGLPKADRTPPANESTKLTDAEFAQLATSESFAKLYTQFLIELPEYSTEGLQETRGAWRTYPQGSDPQSLVDSLEGYPLEWCTANVDTARNQLAGGDFHVYYSLDQYGEPTIPRVAIRMDGSRIAEVRGIAANQNMDPYIGEVVAAKMADFPDGASYTRKAHDMATLTLLEQKLSNNPQAVLSDQELSFLYELNHDIQGFGYQRDPRIDEVRSQRNKELDALELERLIPEAIRAQVESSYAAYLVVARQLGIEPSQQVDLGTLQQLFEYQDAQWRERGVYDYIVEQLLKHNSRHTLLITPEYEASEQQVVALAEAFGKQQSYEAYVYDPLYCSGVYTPAELSRGLQASLGSSQAPHVPLRFSLIPSALDQELSRHAVREQVAMLADRQATHPKLGYAVPSILDSITYWYTLRAQGDSLDDDSAFDRTYVRHFDLPPQQVEGNSVVPCSYVLDDGEPNLVSSLAEDQRSARLLVGCNQVL